MHYEYSSVTRPLWRINAKASLILTMMLASASKWHERMGGHPASCVFLLKKVTVNIRWSYAIFQRLNDISSQNRELHEFQVGIYIYGRTDFNIYIYDWSPIDPMRLLIITKFSLQMPTENARKGLHKLEVEISTELHWDFFHILP